MKLVLIRHADPDYPNDTITGKGHQQAELLGERFSHIPVKSMYVSSMGRAQHTAEYIGRSKKMTWSTHDFLRELDGCYNGTNWAWDYRGSDLFQEHITLSTENWTEIVPYGSHMQPILKRLSDNFDAVLSQYGLDREHNRYAVKKECNDTLLFVCHGGVIHTLLSHLLNIPLPISYAQFRIDTSSVTTLQFDEKDGYGVFRMIGLNDVSHTASMLDADTNRAARN